MLNTPIGPYQSAEEWRAWARLGIAVFGCQVWSARHPYPGRFVCLLSRATDKSVGLTCLALEEVLAELLAWGMLDEVETLVFISDGASHFVSKRSLTFYFHTVPQDWTKNTEQIIGVAHHLKADVDRLFFLAR